MNGGPQLRDIHLPDPASWWPPGPGWWLLLALIIGAGLIIWYWRRSRGQLRLQQLALQELQRIESLFGQHDNERQVLENLSMLLRRIALSRYPREQVASLTGSRWLQFLDSVTGSDEFSKGPGRVLAEGPYNPALQADIPDLIDVCRRWLEAEFKKTETAAKAITTRAKAII
jgi:hypothetical protein